jgi:hypothetical protein
MTTVKLENQLSDIAHKMHWKRWSIGLLGNALFYLEYETPDQYDEWQFEDESSLVEFIKNFMNRYKDRSNE